MGLVFWKCLYEVRGKKKQPDQISLQFGKTETLGFISYIILYNSLAKLIKKSVPQLITINFNAFCTEDKHLKLLLARSINFIPHTLSTKFICTPPPQS